jgi:tetratricopeptide (TPR) repeat protein
MRKLILVGLAALAVWAVAGCQTKEATSLKIYLQQKLWDKAIAQGNQALLKTPNNGDTHYFLGVAYYGKDSDLKPEAPGYADSSEAYLRKAYDHFSQAKKLAPSAWGKSADDNIVSMFGRHYNRGVIASKKKEDVTAAMEYRLATIADPENLEGYYAHAAALLALSLEAKTKGDEAKFTELSDVVLKDLDRVIELKPTDKEKLVSTWQTRGEVLYKRGDTAGAQASYQKAVDLDPENYELMLTVGERFFNANDFENAASYFAQAMGIQERLNLVEESDVDAYIALGTAYTKLGKRDEAIDAFEKALKIKPNDPIVMYNVMVSHYKTAEAAEKDGKMDEAKAACAKCILIGNDIMRIDTSRPEVWQVRGYCKRIAGDTPGAASDLKKFNELRQSPR